MCRKRLQNRRLRRSDSGLNLATHFMQPVREGREQIGFRCNRHSLSAKMKMTVEHCINQLTALAAILCRNRDAADARKKAHQLIVDREAREPFKQLIRNS